MTFEITPTTVQPLDLGNVLDALEWTRQMSCSQVRQNVMDVLSRAPAL